MTLAKTHNVSFTAWVAAVEHADWDKAEALLATDVIVNGKALARHAHVQTLKTERIGTTKLDICIVDDESGDIAARFLHLGAREAALNPGEQWTEQTLYSFTDGKISTIQSLTGPNSTGKNTDTNAIDKGTVLDGASQEPGLHQFYANYIDSINTLTMGKHFGTFCQDVVTHNNHCYRRDEYREMIESSFEDISGLHFTIERLIVNQETQQVAARLGFTGVPLKEFRGIQPTGKGVTFSEHAFYKLEQGRIKQVWSLLDLEAYRVSISS